MSEFITIQVGQCGNQIGSAFWPLVLREYGLLSDVKNRALQMVYDDAFHCFFDNPRSKICQNINDLKDGYVKARALLVDMETSVVARFQRGILKEMFDNECQLINYPGSGNNWAVGHYTHGDEQESNLSEMIRKSAEKCDNLNGFILIFSLSGGTGSGLGTRILTIVNEMFPKSERICVCVHPGSFTDVITSPYNIAFSFEKLVNYASCVLPVDNKALLDICNRQKINQKNLTWKPYKYMNTIICQMLLQLTGGSRFSGSTNSNLRDISSWMVPQQSLNFISTGLSPISLVKEKDVALTMRIPEKVLYSSWYKENHLLRFYPFSPKQSVLSACLLGRGNVTTAAMKNYVQKLVTRAKLTDENGVKTGFCPVQCLDQPSSLLCLSNSTATSQLFEETLTQFNMLYKRKAHVHHYKNVDGFDPSQFEMTKNFLKDTINNYNLAQYQQL